MVTVNLLINKQSYRSSYKTFTFSAVEMDVSVAHRYPHVVTSMWLIALLLISIAQPRQTSATGECELDTEVYSYVTFQYERVEM